MAEQIGHPIVSYSMIPKLVCLTFYPNGTSNSPLTFVGKGVASVVRNSTAGEFVVTLSENYAQLVAYDGCVQLNAAADQKVQFGAFSNLGTSTPTSFIVRTLAVATATDIVANANNSVSVWVLFNDSGVQ